MTVPPRPTGAVLTVDLDAVVSNYRLLRRMLDRAACAAVVKADAYGLGAARVSAALEAAGCRSFFVAHLEEGLALRRALSPESRISVLNGLPQGTEATFVAAGLIPVLNSREQIAAWRGHAGRLGRRLPSVLQVDSGMARLGLAPSEVRAIAADPSFLEGLSVELVMSHLACADEPGHPANASQLSAFDRLRSLLPAAPASLANSSGIFLGRDFHFDLARPGAALYGINPTPSEPNPMRPVVRLSAPLIQLREVDAGRGIGYGHAASARRPSRLAILSLGYADGWPRNAEAAAWLGKEKLAFIGRVSMDSIILDATGCAAHLEEGAVVDLIGPHQTVDDVATAAGTIGYEIIARLGRRLHRRYAGAHAGTASDLSNSWDSSPVPAKAGAGS